MRSLRKFLPRTGLMSALLIGGVLGGLMAPPLSEAVPPTITLQIDGLTPLQRTTNPAGTTFENVTGNSILGSSVACSGADIGLGYTNCYSIVTSTTVAYRANNGRLYRIQNAPNSTARLRVGDNPGQDHLSLVGVQFVPVNTANQVAPTPTATVVLNTLTNWGSPAANTTERHTLTISINNTFNSNVNTNNATTYTGTIPNENTKLPAAIRMGGHFTTGIVDTIVTTPNPLFCGPSTTAGAAGTVKCDTVGDRVQYSAQGRFKDGVLQPVLSPAGSANNASPLSFTVDNTDANRNLTSASFDGLSNARMGQVDPTYPKFECRTGPGSTTCQEEVTQTITVTLEGPDTFVLASGADCFLARCNAQDQTRLTRLFTLISNVVAFLDWWESAHTDNPPLRAFIMKAQAFLANFNTTPSDPNCPATRLIQAQMLFNALIDQRTFALVGALPGDPAPPAPETGTIRIIKNTSGPGGGETSDTFTFNITGPSSSAPEINMGGMSNRQTDLITVNAGPYSISEVPLAGWTLNQGDGVNGAPRCYDGESTFGTTAFEVGPGASITCTFNNSTATGIKLTWGAQPLDLDSHLYVPNGYHVFFPNENRGSLGSLPFAALDLDDVDGFGPEIITVVRWMKGTYQYFVHNFNGTFTPGMTGSPARVDLIQGSTITNTYSPPADEGANLYWHVFNVVVGSDCGVSITPVNRWLASLPPQATPSEELCPVP